MNRLEADAIASVMLDAGDTRPEIDFRAAVRDLAKAAQNAVDDYYIASGKVPTSDGDGYGSLRQCRLAIERHAAAIAAAKEET